MDEVGRLILLLALAGGALTVLGGAFVWFIEDGRRIRRSLKKVLGAEPNVSLIARGKGIGFDFAEGMIAVAWDTGAWCLVYRLEELRGAELVVDDRLAARVGRSEPARDLDEYGAAAERVRLRFLFDDPRWSDFELDLWSAADAGRRRALTSQEAVQEGGRWINRMDALLRKSRRLAPAVAPTPAPAATPAPRNEPPVEDVVGDVD